MGKLFRTILFISLAFCYTANAQDDLTKSLSGLLDDAGKAYVGPIGSAFGADLNSGWVHRAPKAKIFGVDFELGFVVMGTMFGSEAKSFDISTKFQMSYDQAMLAINKDPNSVNMSPAIKDKLATELTNYSQPIRVYGPTIVGKKTDEIMIVSPAVSTTVGGVSYSVKGQSIGTGLKGVLDELPALPLFAPQVTLGTIYGTSVAVRYLPSVKVNDELGEFKYQGFGIMHNPQVWPFIPSLPLELAISYFSQTMTVGKYFDASATTFGVFASKQFGWGLLNLTPYAGFSKESSTLKVSYPVEIKTSPTGTPFTKNVSFELEGENSTRITLGASLKILVLSLNADYNIAKYKSYSAGLSFNF